MDAIPGTGIAPGTAAENGISYDEQQFEQLRRDSRNRLRWLAIVAAIISLLAVSASFNLTTCLNNRVIDPPEANYTGSELGVAIIFVAIAAGLLFWTIFAQRRAYTTIIDARAGRFGKDADERNTPVPFMYMDVARFAFPAFVAATFIFVAIGLQYTAPEWPRQAVMTTTSNSTSTPVVVDCIQPDPRDAVTLFGGAAAFIALMLVWSFWSARNNAALLPPIYIVDRVTRQQVDPASYFDGVTAPMRDTEMASFPQQNAPDTGQGNMSAIARALDSAKMHSNS